jgi:hypothetical protein
LAKYSEDPQGIFSDAGSENYEIVGLGESDVKVVQIQPACRLGRRASDASPRLLMQSKGAGFFGQPIEADAAKTQSLKTFEPVGLLVAG